MRISDWSSDVCSSDLALAAQTQKLVQGLVAAAKEADTDFSADAVGGMFGLYFAAETPDSYATMMQCDKERFNHFFHAMLDAGVYLAQIVRASCMERVCQYVKISLVS